jgi:hypothetical protein
MSAELLYNPSMRRLFPILALILAACSPATQKGSISPLPLGPTYLAPGTALASPSAPTLDANAAEAREIMMRFFSALNAGDYQMASELYGGSYEALISWNPDVQPSDKTALWRRACQQNGLQCLPVSEVVDANQVSANVMEFTIHFRNPDGSLFVLGPCCGENETTMPPVNEFKCSVARTSDGDLKVMCLPPYVP